jgi:hypothetical protein
LQLWCYQSFAVGGVTNVLQLVVLPKGILFLVNDREENSYDMAEAINNFCGHEHEIRYMLN